MAKKHLVYKDLQGNPLPSVTTILNVINKPGLWEWKLAVGKKRAEQLKEAAGEFGTTVHSAVQSIVEDGQVPTYADVRVERTMCNLQKWLDNNIVRWYCMEIGVYHDTLRYGGTFDGIAELKSGKIALIDFKGLPLTTPIPTPTGWSTIQDIEVGDEVLGRNGLPCKVTDKSAIHKRKCYQIFFDDSSTIVADDEHQWVVESITKRNTKKFGEKILRTDELKTWIPKSIGIRMTEPLDLPTQSLPIPPYTYGAWLGDGCRSEGKITGQDIEIFENIEEEGFSFSLPHSTDPLKVPTRTIYGLRTLLRVNELKDHKKIPQTYLRASLSQRLSLLQGLMDTDGTYNKIRRQAVFVNTEKHLAEEVFELVCSLGERPYFWAGRAFGFDTETTQYRVIWTPQKLCPFKLKRKADLVQYRQPRADTGFRKIIKVEEVEAVYTQCLSVDSIDNTYLAGKYFLPTHNSSKRVNPEYYLQLTAYARAERIEDDVFDLSKIDCGLIVHLNHETLMWESVVVDVHDQYLWEIFKGLAHMYPWWEKYCAH